MRRGFKSEANWWSREMRRELELQPIDPICPWALCEHLGIPVQALSEFGQHASEAVAYLGTPKGRKEFSAVTGVDCGHRFIIHNDTHNRKRQASNLAHEIAHALLQHPAHAMLNAHGQRIYDRMLEEEAGWLGPALLISEEAALHIAATMTNEQASEIYGASLDVVRMRLNVLGAHRRVA
ncbi:protein of unknown function [Aureimonas altamirensis DSM 21988]|uniref:IrrE N-terminal-like domain-containing protein n=1 Tax=Aureimonas altamirensis DSM 21988 TaxID=1121026 RepID=A0ABY1IPH6_9HYPH|nr:protein of unknown function [Aureimonas altamirensis DSM 21988]